MSSDKSPVLMIRESMFGVIEGQSAFLIVKQTILQSQSSRGHASTYGSLPNIENGENENDGKVHLCGVFIFGIMLLVYFGLPISSIVIGSLYKNLCPADNHIPLTLIIFGGIWVICHILPFISSADNHACEAFKKFFSFCFLVALIVVSVYVYKTSVSYLPTDGNFCHKILYLYTYWIISAIYIIMALLLLCGCCIANFSETE